MIQFLTSIDPIIYIDIFWAVVVIIMLIIEFCTDDLTSIWFAVGGMVALIISLCGVKSIVIQFSAFLAVSIILLLCLRKFLKKFLIKKTIATNADALIGKEIQILADASSSIHGEGKINGIVWTIITEDENVIKAGEKALITKIIGNKLVVKKL